MYMCVCVCVPQQLMLSMGGRFHRRWVAHMANKASKRHKLSSKVSVCSLHVCVCVCIVLVSPRSSTEPGGSSFHECSGHSVW